MDFLDPVSSLWTGRGVFSGRETRGTPVRSHTERAAEWFVWPFVGPSSANHFHIRPWRCYFCPVIMMVSRLCPRRTGPSRAYGCPCNCHKTHKAWACKPGHARVSIGERMMRSSVTTCRRLAKSSSLTDWEVRHVSAGGRLPAMAYRVPEAGLALASSACSGGRHTHMPAPAIRNFTQNNYLLNTWRYQVLCTCFSHQKSANISTLNLRLTQTPHRASFIKFNQLQYPKHQAVYS